MQIGFINFEFGHDLDDVFFAGAGVRTISAVTSRIRLVKLAHEEWLDPVTVACILVGDSGKLGEVLHDGLRFADDCGQIAQTAHRIVLHAVLTAP